MEAEEKRNLCLKDCPNGAVSLGELEWFEIKKELIQHIKLDAGGRAPGGRGRRQGPRPYAAETGLSRGHPLRPFLFESNNILNSTKGKLLYHDETDKRNTARQAAA